MVKALSLFSPLKGSELKGDATIFSASRGRFRKIRERTVMLKAELTGEAARFVTLMKLASSVRKCD
jgi:hypothetical protein